MTAGAGQVEEPPVRACKFCNVIDPSFREGRCTACGEPSK
jgi:hypothetical protein